MPNANYSPEAIKQAIKDADRDRIHLLIKETKNSARIAKLTAMTLEQQKAEFERQLLFNDRMAPALYLRLVDILGVQSLEETQRRSNEAAIPLATEANRIAKEANRIAEDAKSESAFSKRTTIIGIIIAGCSFLVSLAAFLYTYFKESPQ